VGLQKKSPAAGAFAIWYDSPVLSIGGTQASGPRAMLAGLGPLAEELFERSGASKYGLPLTDFVGALEQIARKYLPAGDARQTEELLRSLRVEELALARACAAGSEKAWEEFLTRYRERLFDAGRAIAKDDATGRELADSLYADLYGTTTRDGKRVSKLASYYGRGSLEGWLRTVLAQEFVNRYRTHKRTVSLEEQEEDGKQFAAAPVEPPISADARVDQATDAALASLRAEERFVLAAYFLDGRTLSEVARTLGVHESTISRKVEKLTTTLRKKIVEQLTSRGMSRRQAEEALESDVRDLRVDVRARLAQDKPGATFLDSKGQQQ
jgi:RNA polymerase sigma-70 factor (ECF subfamily)